MAELRYFHCEKNNSENERGSKPENKLFFHVSGSFCYANRAGKAAGEEDHRFNKRHFDVQELMRRRTAKSVFVKNCISCKETRKHDAIGHEIDPKPKKSIS